VDLRRGGFAKRWVCEEVGLRRGGFAKRWVCEEVGFEGEETAWKALKGVVYFLKTNPGGLRVVVGSVSSDIPCDFFIVARPSAKLLFSDWPAQQKSTKKSLQP
jgi:hypothetical protein